MKKMMIAAAALFLGACAVYTVPSAKDAAKAKPGGPAPVAAGKPLEFSAWLVFWEPLSWTSFEANVSRLTRVYPEAYTCQPDGLPGRIGVASAENLKKTVDLAHQHGVKVLGTMNNYASETSDFEKKRVEKFLNDRALMEKHVDGLLALAKADGLDGLDVDYEALAAEDRGTFTAFVTRLAEKAHAAGLEVGIAVHPKDSEPGTWDGPKAQDYAALGRAVDHFHVMTYDFHWASGSPGPVAPLPWVRSVIAYTATLVPKEKLEMGLNAYGLHWSPKGKDLKWPDYLALQAKYGRFTRDEQSGELSLNYANGEAWMPDALSHQAKFSAARELGIQGLAMWMLGQEDPKLWAVVDAFKGAR